MKKCVICCGPDWHRSSVSSTEQLISRFHQDGFFILWMNPIAFRSPFTGSATSKSAWKKIKNKFITHFKFLHRARDNYWIWAPFYLPIFNSFFNIINGILIRMQFIILKLIFLIRSKNSILWCAPGVTASYLLSNSFSTIVYEAHDLISEFRTQSNALSDSLQQKEAFICSKADLIFAASETIQKKIKLIVPNKKIELLLHGVDYKHFSVPVPLSAEISQIRSNKLPVAGYFGSLSDANDKDVFLALANNGFSVVIIGQILGDYSALYQHPNIYFIGPVKYNLLPSWAQGFDVALLNWRMHNWIENCFPVKTLEYLACGLPIVSCKIPVLQKHYSSVVSFADSPESFVEKCQVAIAGNSKIKIDERRQIVRCSSWDSKYHFVKDLINEF